MLAPSTLEAASILELARNKLRNNHATTTEKVRNILPQKNTELVARFFVDEHGKLQPHRRVIFCSDCRHYIPSPPIPRPHGVNLPAPGGCTQGRTTPDALPPIFPFTGHLCTAWNNVHTNQPT